MKKLISLVVVSVMILGSITGCGHEHTWVDATCTEPKTCTGCGETEGEALGHDWKEATCTEPKTCSRCGQTEGEALGHKLSEANYQDAPVCSVCGETVGEPLEAAFEKYGLKCNVEYNVPRDFNTQGDDDPNMPVTGEIVFYDYEVFESDDEHEAVEGYEWRSVIYQITFKKEDYDKYGWISSDTTTDYYTLLMDENGEFDGESLNYHGKDYTDIYEDRVDLGRFTDKDGNPGFGVKFYERVPIGYDGIVIVIADGKARDSFDGNIATMDNTNTLFFRLDVDE